MVDVNIVSDEILTHTCRKCKRARSTTDFYKDKHRKSGLCNICIDCNREVKGCAKRLLLPNEFKKCHCCQEIKTKADFSIKKTRYDGLQSHCRKCQSSKNKSYRKNNTETILNYCRGRAEFTNSMKRQRFKKDPLFNVKLSLQSRMKYYWKHSGFTKPNKTEILIGGTFQTVANHIEKQFKDGMNWENRGKWHIDHKIPLASATTIEELLELFNYKNLQPLWAIDNLRKGANMER
jgi:hypothetical protein